MNVKVHFKKTQPEGVLPRRSTTHAACYDVFASETVVVLSGKPTRVSLGFAIAIPTGWRVDIHDRRESGHALKGLRVHHGIIDSDYRGEVAAILSLDFGEWVVRSGDRIAQISINQVHEMHFEEVEDLPPPDSNRVGGFGSTGT